MNYYQVYGSVNMEEIKKILWCGSQYQHRDNSSQAVDMSMSHFSQSQSIIVSQQHSVKFDNESLKNSRQALTNIDHV